MERVQDSAMQEKSQLVELTFFDKNAHAHSWPGLKTVGNQRNVTEINNYPTTEHVLQRLRAKGKARQGRDARNARLRCVFAC